MRLIIILTASMLLSACQTQYPSYPRAHGEDWKFYPFTPGTSITVAEQGRKCWAEENRANWDQCN